MLQLQSTTKYYLYQQTVDMRKGAYGLCGIVQNQLKHDILHRDVFVFINKKHNTLKLLQWDIDGFALYEKKLARGSFEYTPQRTNDGTVLLTHYQLHCILQGIILQSIKMKKRYVR